MKAFSLLPRKDNFYTDLSTLSAQAAACARYLKNYIESNDEAARKKNIGDIKAGRAQSKSVMNAMTGALARSFITPFDREDLQDFSYHLYRIPKMIDKVVQRIELHGLSGAQADFARQAGLIVEESDAMEIIIGDLIHRHNAKEVTEKVALLNDLEQKGDDILQELLARLFTEPRDVRDLLLRRDIYDLLEKVIDSYRDAAATALQIVLKYG
jgi:uncharacterized protein Yka (UPF0111/DUF47 family)